MGWREIPGTEARYAYRRVERDGVAVLCVRLAGYAENSADGVTRVCDGLDEVAAAHTEWLDVTTLDVRGFCNALDDACGILTGVFAGLPCCWISHDWDQQRGGERWDLPAAERLAATGSEALARVVGWRRAGGFSIDHGGGCVQRWAWGERGLVVTTTRGGQRDMADVYHRNQLVERALGGGRRVLWPRVDATGVASEASRRGARLVLEGEEVIEADFTRWSTGRALPEDWPAWVADLVGLRELDVRAPGVRESELLAVVAGLPALVVLWALPDALGPAARAELARTRPGLAIR